MLKTGSKITILCLFLIISLALLLPQSSLAAQKGSLTYATNYSMFFNKGGDTATHAAGEGPLLATTVFEGLVDTQVDLTDGPSIAKSWVVAPDWSYMEFELEKGVKFHNGAEVTAEDVKYSFEVTMQPKRKHVLGHSYRQRIDNIEVKGRYTVRFNLKMPSPGLMKRFWWSGGIFPKAYREKVGDDGFADKPIGSGPFKWVGYKQDVYYEMEAMPTHHRKAAEFKKLKIVYVPEASTRLAMLMAGEADIVVLSGPNIPQVKADPNFQLIQTKHIIGQTLKFADLSHPDEKSPFHDIRVREATSLAINRAAISKKVMFDGVEPYGEVMAPYTLGWDPNVKPDPYDPEKARALLKAAGYPKGFDTTISTTSGLKYWVEAISANLHEVGIRAKVNIMEGGAWWGAFTSKKHRGIITGGSWYDVELNPGADLQDAYTKEAPWHYVTTQEISDAVKESMRAKNDKEAAAMGRKISKLIRDSRINVHLWSIHANYGVSKKVKKWDRQLGSYPATRFEYIEMN